MDSDSEDFARWWGVCGIAITIFLIIFTIGLDLYPYTYSLVQFSSVYLITVLIITVVLGELIYFFAYNSKNYLEDKVAAVLWSSFVAYIIGVPSVWLYRHQSAIDPFLGWLGWVGPIVGMIVGVVVVIVLFFVVNVEIKKRLDAKKKPKRKKKVVK